MRVDWATPLAKYIKRLLQLLSIVHSPWAERLLPRAAEARNPAIHRLLHFRWLFLVLLSCVFVFLLNKHMCLSQTLLSQVSLST